MLLRLAVIPGLAAASSLCATPQKATFQLGLPGSQIGMTVARVVPRGPYLEVELRAPGLDLVGYAPADATCRELLAEEQQIEYRSGGTGGSFERAGKRCDAVGIGSLDEWRRRRPQPRTRSPVPSAQASYRVIYFPAGREVLTLTTGEGLCPIAGLLVPAPR